MLTFKRIALHHRFLNEEPGEGSSGAGSSDATPTSEGEEPVVAAPEPSEGEELEVLRRSLKNSKGDKAKLQEKLSAAQSEAENWLKLQGMLQKEGMTTDDLRDWVASQKKEQAAAEEYERLTQKFRSESQARLEQVELDYQKKIKNLENRIEERDLYDDFFMAFQKAGGLITDPDPYTNQTKHEQFFGLIKPYFRRGDSNEWVPVDSQGKRIPTENGEGFKDIYDFIESLSMSDNYADYFLDRRKLPAGGNFGLNSAGGQNFPSGVRIVSQKDFERGAVDFDAIANGKLKVKRGR